MGWSRCTRVSGDSGCAAQAAAEEQRKKHMYEATLKEANAKMAEDKSAAARLPPAPLVPISPSRCFAVSWHNSA